MIVLARRDDRLGLLDAAAAVAATRPGMPIGRASATVTGNGWDGLAMEAGASLDLPVVYSGAADLEIRVAGRAGREPAGRPPDASSG